MKYSDGGLSASASEVEYWEIFRPNIYGYVGDGKIWISPDTGRQLERCPWLQTLPNQDKSRPEKYTCAIYNDRPDDCKHYPVTITQMVADECEMIEVQDLKNPRQAQKVLDQIMVDSRPSISK